MKTTNLLFILLIIPVILTNISCKKVEGHKYYQDGVGCPWGCDILFHETQVELCPPGGNQYAYIQEGDKITITYSGSTKYIFNQDANGSLVYVTENGCKYSPYQ